MKLTFRLFKFALLCFCIYYLYLVKMKRLLAVDWPMLDGVVGDDIPFGVGDGFSGWQTACRLTGVHPL